MMDGMLAADAVFTANVAAVRAVRRVGVVDYRPTVIDFTAS